MAGINKIILIGNIGRDPEIRYSQGGNTAVADFSLAVTEKRKDRDGRWSDQTEWFKVISFGRTTENYVSKYLKRGNAPTSKADWKSIDGSTEMGKTKSRLK